MNGLYGSYNGNFAGSRRNQWRTGAREIKEERELPLNGAFLHILWENA